jgi:hypothetical protein
MFFMCISVKDQRGGSVDLFLLVCLNVFCSFNLQLPNSNIVILSPQVTGYRFVLAWFFVLFCFVFETGS